MTEGAVFWDVGSNIGLYSCYAAKARGIRVFACEPSVFNLELLAKNIYLNELVEKVVIVPLPLSDSIKTSTLNMSTMEWGVRCRHSQRTTMMMVKSLKYPSNLVRLAYRWMRR